MAAQPASTLPSPESSLTRVTDSQQIYHLVRRVQEGRSLLNVTVRGQSKSYLSAVLDVNAVEGYLLLDELTPVEGHEALLRVGRLNVYTQCQGVDVSFNSEVQHSGIEGGGALYRVAMPEVVYYSQRREDYRVRINLGRAIPLVYLDDAGRGFEGVLHDISAGGLSADLLKLKDVAIKPGQVLSNCLIKQIADHPLNVSIEIRFVAHGDNGHGLRVGSRFLDLPGPEQRAIRQFVATLDREWRRKLSKD
jgi:c-di-GMP-binding flagellar brake protein YcgR